jgi:hypothetical protein
MDLFSHLDDFQTREADFKSAIKSIQKLLHKRFDTYIKIDDNLRPIFILAALCDPNTAFYLLSLPRSALYQLVELELDGQDDLAELSNSFEEMDVLDTAQSSFAKKMLAQQLAEKKRQNNNPQVHNKAKDFVDFMLMTDIRQPATQFWTEVGLQTFVSSKL